MALKLRPLWWEGWQTLGRAQLNLGEVDLVSLAERCKEEKKQDLFEPLVEGGINIQNILEASRPHVSFHFSVICCLRRKRKRTFQITPRCLKLGRAPQIMSRRVSERNRLCSSPHSQRTRDDW